MMIIGGRSSILAIGIIYFFNILDRVLSNNRKIIIYGIVFGIFCFTIVGLDFQSYLSDVDFLININIY